MEDEFDWHVSHEVTYEVSITWARFGMLSLTYAAMAEQAFSEFLEERKNPVIDDNSDECHEANYAANLRLTKASIKTTVFAAMACEAAIFDLAAIHLGDKVAALLDKMDAVGKWATVPKLICGSSLDVGGAAINSLRTLVTTRNSLVHYKSLKADPVEEALAKGRKQAQEIIDNTIVGFKAMVLLSLELNRLLKTPAGVLPFYEVKNNTLQPQQFSEEMLKVLNACRKIDGDASSKRRI